MIEVHVFNAFLLPELRQTGWFSVINFLNGLVAPAFLFVSGFAFNVSSGSKLDEMRKLKFPFWKKLSRIFLIILIGYALHLHYFPFSKVLSESTPQQLADFVAVDVLQCIGAGLLILFIVRLIIGSDKIYHYSLIFLTLFVMTLSPLLWNTDLTNYFHPLIANYFNRLNGSLFPIFPWINFILAGAIFGKYFLEAREKNFEQKIIKNAAFLGLALLFLGHLFYSDLIPGFLKKLSPHPVFFFERLGYVLVITSLCWFYNNIREVKKSFVLDASRESLLVYWLHLVVIYGMFWGGRSLAIFIGQNLNALESVTATLLLITLMILAAKIWGAVKKKYPEYTSKLVLVFTLLFLVIFLII